MQEIACPKCKITFFLLDEVNNRFRESGENFFCPNGHSMSYTDSTTAKLKAAEKRVERYYQYFQEERATSMRLARSKAALRAVITRMKNKAAGQNKGA